MSLFSLKELPIGRKGSNIKYIGAVKAENASSTTAQFRGKTVNAKPMTQSINNGNSSIINICDSFDWTTTPFQNSGFKKELITRGEINEYRVADDSVIAGIQYNIDAIQGGAAELAANIVQGLTQLGLSVAPLQQIFPNAAQAAGNAAGSSLKEGINLLSDLAKKFANNFRDTNTGLGALGADKFEEKWMQPYTGLYSLTPTDFKYIFPYLDSKYVSIDAQTQEINFPPAQMVAAAADAVSTYNKIISPGQYVEKPVIYDPAASSKPSVTFNFPLINTQSFESAVKNYQFLWLFIYQNTPYRATKMILELPKMYEVNVPGVEYMAFSIVESLNIKFIGNRRHVDIPMPATEGTPATIKAIVPDAYDVSITFRSLTKRSSNMMLQMLKKSNFNL